jgi:VWFA-related protein
MDVPRRLSEVDRPRVLLVLLCAVAAGTTLAGTSQKPTFHTDTNTVSLYTTVLDSRGHLVSDLTRDDFEILDNGVPQPLTVFDNGVQPITLVMMLDRSGSMVQNYRLVREAAEEFVANLLPDDRTRIGSFSTRIRIDPESFTSDKSELLQILREKLQEQGPTPLWNATAEAMDALAREDGRRVVLTFTDGKDTPGWMPTRVDAEDIRRRSLSEEIMIYAIGLSERCGPDPAPTPASNKPSYQRRPGGIPRFPGVPGGGPVGPRIPTIPGLPGGPIDGGRRPTPTWPTPVDRDVNPCADAGPDPELRTLADEGGGGYFELRGTDDLRATFARVAQELHHQYLLAFVAPVLDGEVHRLDVRVKKPFLTARARKSYVAR